MIHTHTNFSPHPFSVSPSIRSLSPLLAYSLCLFSSLILSLSPLLVYSLSVSSPLSSSLPLTLLSSFLIYPSPPTSLLPLPFCLYFLISLRSPFLLLFSYYRSLYFNISLSLFISLILFYTLFYFFIFFSFPLFFWVSWCGVTIREACLIDRYYLVSWILTESPLQNLILNNPRVDLL